jgi:hypothetical protein
VAFGRNRAKLQFALTRFPDLLAGVEHPYASPSLVARRSQFSIAGMTLQIRRKLSSIA